MLGLVGLLSKPKVMGEQALDLKQSVAAYHRFAALKSGSSISCLVASDTAQLGRLSHQHHRLVQMLGVADGNLPIHRMNTTCLACGKLRPCSHHY